MCVSVMFLQQQQTGFYVLRCLLGLAEAAGTSSGGHLLAQFYPQSRYGDAGMDMNGHE